MKNKRKGFSLPHVYLLFMIVMLFIVILSWIIPAGEFERTMVEGSRIPKLNPDKFTYLDNVKPIGFMDFFSALHEGVVNAGNLIVLLLFASGGLYILESSGTIKSGIHALLKKSAGKESFVLIIFSSVFGLMGAIGFGEGSIPFFPLMITIAVSLGYDRMTGFATAAIPLAVGFASGVVNLYTTGISQQILGLPLFSGIEFRIIAFLIFMLVGMYFVLTYAKRIKKDPTKSIMSEEYIEQLKSDKEEVKEENVIAFDFRRKLALFGLVILVIVTVLGATKLKFGFPQMSALYILLAIYLTIVLKLNPNEVAKDFGIGAARLLPASLAIGFAGSVMVLMNKAKIVDTVIYNLTSFLQGQTMLVTLLIVFLAVIGFNFLVVSGSGKALILMPILGPIGEILGINKQILVLVYQYGDGFTNYLYPTSGALMAILAMTNIKYGKWLKFAVLPFIILHILAFALIMIANSIGLQ